MTHAIRRVSRRVLTAALPHRCNLCGGMILPGQKYVRIVSVVDSRFGTERYHRRENENDPDPCKRPMKSSKHFVFLDDE